MSLFSEKGYRGTKIEDIAKLTGFGKASLYYYFRNKEEIFSAIVLDTLDTLLNDMSAMTSGEKSPEAEMELIINHFVNEKFEKTGLFQVFHQLQTFFAEIDNHEVRTQVIGKLVNVMDTVNSVMVRGRKTGSVRGESPETLGGIFMGMVFGTVFFTGGPVIPPEGKDDYASLLRSIIISGFCPPDTKE